MSAWLRVVDPVTGRDFLAREAALWEIAGKTEEDGKLEMILRNLETGETASVEASAA